MSRSLQAVAKFLAFFCLFINFSLNSTNAAGLINRKAIQLGLYTSSDYVVILNNTNFSQLVLKQNRSSLVEFYNSYCGHCKRFAPVYKKLAEKLKSWEKTLMIAAIDCAVEENNDVCREYEIMGYPSIRYFGANFTPAEKHYGLDVVTQNPIEIRNTVAAWLAAEYDFLQPLSHEKAIKIMSDQLEPELGKIIVFDYANTTTGIQVALHLRQYENLLVFYTANQTIASMFDLTRENCISLIINKNTTKLSCTGFKNEEPTSYLTAIKQVLIQQDFILVSNLPQQQPPETEVNTTLAELTENNEIIALVKRQMHTVYQADLEMAVQSMLFNEIPRASNISGERLLALKQILQILHRYKPLSYRSNGNALLTHMYKYVSEYNQQLAGADFSTELHRMQKELGSPTFMANRYIGCVGTSPNYRGFTCSLWQLFHHLTVKVSLFNDDNHKAEDVLKAIYGYVKYYFGCTECAQHFQEMASRRNIWGVNTTEAGILWLWAAHNEVNARLKGDTTEDPNFPKIAFPSEASCAKCYTLNNNIKSFNETAVLQFLQTIHNYANISEFGLETTGEGVIFSNSSSGEKMRQKRMTLQAFADLDMRFVMLLYSCCILMIIFAFKMFVFKRSRRVKILADFSGRA